MRVIKLSEYAILNGVTYRTAWNRFKTGKIPNAYKDDFGNVLVKIENDNLENYNKVAIYTRVSSNEKKKNLNVQVNNLKQYAMAKGYQIVEIVKEVGSGMNDNRPKLLKLLQKETYGVLLVEHKEKLTRFGFNYIEALLEVKKIKLEVVNEAEDDTTDLKQDLISIVSSFSTRLYGVRKSKRATEEIVKILEKNDDTN